MKINVSSWILAPAVMVGSTVPAVTAYTGVGHGCRPSSSTFRGRVEIMSPHQRAKFRRQQADFVNRAFEAMTDDLQRTTKDPNFTPKQWGQKKEFVNKAVDFFRI